MQSKLPMHLSRRCGAQTRSGSQCQSPGMANGRCRMHGGPSPGAPKGNRNALKHGRYTADAIENRREIAMLLSAMKALASTAGEGANLQTSGGTGRQSIVSETRDEIAEAVSPTRTRFGNHKLWGPIWGPLTNHPKKTN
jgi:hypothetical protein